MLKHVSLSLLSLCRLVTDFASRQNLLSMKLLSCPVYFETVNTTVPHLCVLYALRPTLWIVYGLFFFLYLCSYCQMIAFCAQVENELISMKRGDILWKKRKEPKKWIDILCTKLGLFFHYRQKVKNYVSQKESATRVRTTHEISSFKPNYWWSAVLLLKQKISAHGMFSLTLISPQQSVPFQHSFFPHGSNFPCRQKRKS